MKVFVKDMHWKACMRLLGGVLFLTMLVLGAGELFAAKQAAKQIVKQLGGFASPLQGGGWELEFQLRGQDLTDEGLKLVASLDDVVILNLRDTKITSTGLKHIRNFTNLRRLHIERTAVDDSGIPFLASLSQLEYLNLYGTRITDKSLKSLSALKNLRQLFVWQTGVTTKGVEELRKSLPKLKVSMGVDLLTIVDEKKRDKPEDPTVLKWLPEGGDKKPPKRSVFGTFIMVYFENKRSHPVKLYWIDYNGQLKFYADIDVGAKREQTSYSGAVWRIDDAQDQALGYFVTTQKSSIAVIPKE